jgi:hypothetical protein
LYFPFFKQKIGRQSILIGFMSMGAGIQGVLREYAATKDAHEEEAIKRVRIEEQNRALVEHPAAICSA